MKTGIILIFALFLLCGSHILSAQTLFIWTDEAGVVHFSDSKPPEGIQIEEKLHYQKQPSKRPPKPPEGIQIEEKLHYQKQPSKRPPESEENRKKGQTDLEKSEAIERAEIEKRKANNAKQKAEEAFKKANQIKKETDEFIQKVKYKSRKSKSLRVKMKRRMEEANKAITEAEQLKQLAIKAEKKGQRR